MDKLKGCWNFVTQEWNNVLDISNDIAAKQYLPPSAFAYQEYEKWRKEGITPPKALMGVSLALIAGILAGNDDVNSLQIANHALKSMVDRDLFYKD